MEVGVEWAEQEPEWRKSLTHFEDLDSKNSLNPIIINTLDRKFYICSKRTDAKVSHMFFKCFTHILPKLEKVMKLESFEFDINGIIPDEVHIIFHEVIVTKFWMIRLCHDVNECTWCANCSLHINIWNFWLISFYFTIKEGSSKSY